MSRVPSARIHPKAEVLMAAVASVLIFGSPAMAAAGDLDMSFSGDGLALTGVPGEPFATAESVAVYPDGKVAVAGQAVCKAVAARYRVGGRIDPEFGEDGVVGPFFYSSTSCSTVHALALQGDGRLIMVGGAGQSNFGIARLTGGGRLDAAFSRNGKVVVDFGGYDEASAVLVRPDGKIVVVGAGTAAGLGTYIAVTRLTPGGRIDQTFGTAGRVITPLSIHGWPPTVMLLADGKLLVVSNVNYLTTFVRYHANGALDRSFGSGGIQSSPFAGAENVSGAALQPNGKIVTVGGTMPVRSNDRPFHPTVARYLSDGTLDLAFGSQGRVWLPWDAADARGGDGAMGGDVAIMSDRRIVALATLYSFSEEEEHIPFSFLVARLHPTGELDSSFGGDGWTLVERSEHPQGIKAFDVAIAPDGRPVVAGEWMNKMLAARFAA